MILEPSLDRASRISAALAALSVVACLVPLVPPPPQTDKDAQEALEQLKKNMEDQGGAVKKARPPPIVSPAQLAWAIYWCVNGDPAHNQYSASGINEMLALQRAAESDDHQPAPAWSPILDGIVSIDFLTQSGLATPGCGVMTAGPASTGEALAEYMRPAGRARIVDTPVLARKLQQVLKECGTKDARPLVHNAFWADKCDSRTEAELMVILNGSAGCPGGGAASLTLPLRTVHWEPPHYAGQRQHAIEDAARWRKAVVRADASLLGQPLDDAIAILGKRADAGWGTARWWQEYLRSQQFGALLVLALAILQWLLGFAERTSATRLVGREKFAPVEAVWFPVDASRVGIIVKVLFFTVAPVAGGFVQLAQTGGNPLTGLFLGLLLVGCAWEFVVWVRLRQAVLGALNYGAFAAALRGLLAPAAPANPPKASPRSGAIKGEVGELSRGEGTLHAIVEAELGFVELHAWVEKIQRIERQVCRVEIDGVACGTGFLVGQDLVLTNFHVIEPARDGPASRIKLRFDVTTAGGEGITHDLAAAWLVDSSSYSRSDLSGTGVPAEDELDYALLRTRTSVGAEIVDNDDNIPRGWQELPGGPPRVAPGAALVIVQYPRGEHLKFALDTKAVQSITANRIRYQTNTIHGSSGSPCFDLRWNLVALHHSGDVSFKPKWNQGIPVGAIVALLERRQLWARAPVAAAEAPRQAGA